MKSFCFVENDRAQVEVFFNHAVADEQLKRAIHQNSGAQTTARAAYLLDRAVNGST